MTIQTATDSIAPLSISPEEDRPLESASDADAGQGYVNYGLMALYQVIIRTGWIFKTESIIMPVVLDVIAGQAWVRGCLPMLNRFGQSIPPILASRRVHSTAYKKYALALTTSLMGVTFWALALLWLTTSEESFWWTPIAFLMLYAVFFVSTGVNHLVFETATGKFIFYHHRGRLMLVSNALGVVCAVTCAWVLLRWWLSEASANFFAIFAFTGSCFLAAAFICLLLVERPDSFSNESNGVRALFRSTREILSGDADFRRLVLVASLFGMSTTLFPHYQALGRQRLDLGLDYLLPWVISQNVGMFLFSVPAGWLADRYGNRLVLRTLLLAMCAAPLLSLVLAQLGSVGGEYYFLVFGCVGATPVTIRLFQHYCLELAPRKIQPHYLSTLNLMMAVPAILTSTLLGALLDTVGFAPVFLVVVGCLALGWFLAKDLIEPRKVNRKVG
jgi:hypothetical protein